MDGRVTPPKRVTSPTWGPPPPCKQAIRLAKQQLYSCITLFCTFLCRHCMSTTWKYLTSRFVEDVNTRQRLAFSFPELWYSLLEFNSRENCQHLINWTRWNKRDKVWSSATSLFKWRFRSRRRRCCLRWCYTRQFATTIFNATQRCNVWTVL